MELSHNINITYTYTYTYLYNEMAYLIHLGLCALKNKIVYAVERFYILRKYIPEHHGQSWHFNIRDSE